MGSGGSAFVETTWSLGIVGLAMDLAAVHLSAGTAPVGASPAAPAIVFARLNRLFFVFLTFFTEVGGVAGSFGNWGDADADSGAGGLGSAATDCNASAGDVLARRIILSAGVARIGTLFTRSGGDGR